MFRCLVTCLTWPSPLLQLSKKLRILETTANIYFCSLSPGLPGDGLSDRHNIVKQYNFIQIVSQSENRNRSFIKRNPNLSRDETFKWPQPPHGEDEGQGGQQQLRNWGDECELKRKVKWAAKRPERLYNVERRRLEHQFFVCSGSKRYDHEVCGE